MSEERSESGVNISERVAEALTVCRVRLGFDVETAAAASHMDAERLAEAEAGQTLLTEGELDRIAATYGVDASAFFGARVTPFNYLAGA